MKLFDMPLWYQGTVGFFNLFCFVTYFENPLWGFKMVRAVLPSRSLLMFGPFWTYVLRIVSAGQQEALLDLGAKS